MDVRYVCFDHFENEDILINNTGKRRLRQGGIPISTFNNFDFGIGDTTLFQLFQKRTSR